MKQKGTLVGLLAVMHQNWGISPGGDLNKIEQ